MHQLHLFWESLRSSLWFVPALLVLAAVLLAMVLVEVDSRVQWDGLEEEWPRLFGAGAAGSRQMLAAIATSMITVAGVAFSINVVALVMASGQYTSRILRNFMRDRTNQTVLGVFMAVFAYCLVVLRTIRGGDEGAFVPSLAVFIAVVLAFMAIGFLIYFIHHVSSSIQATSVIQSAANETIHAIDRLFPTEMGSAAAEPPETEPLLEARTWHAIPARRTGYVQSVDENGLLAFAREQDTVLRMERGIGEFVVEGAPLASACGPFRADEGIGVTLDALFSIGRHRTTVQDAGYGIRQIVDVALKALSPGINDTTTAVICVDYLGAALARLAGRQVETPFRMDKGQLRVIARGPTFSGLVGEALDQIRQNASGNVAVLGALLRALEVVAVRTDDECRRKVLRRQAELVATAARRTIPQPEDREEIELTLGRLELVLAR